MQNPIKIFTYDGQRAATLFFNEETGKYNFSCEEGSQKVFMFPINFGTGEVSNETLIICAYWFIKSFPFHLSEDKFEVLRKQYNIDWETLRNSSPPKVENPTEAQRPVGDGRGG